MSLQTILNGHRILIMRDMHCLPPSHSPQTLPHITHTHDNKYWGGGGKRGSGTLQGPWLTQGVKHQISQLYYNKHICITHGGAKRVNSIFLFPLIAKLMQ